LDLRLNLSRAAKCNFLWATIKQKIAGTFLAFVKNKESTMPSMTLHIVFFFYPPSFQPTSIIYYVNNVGATLVLLRFARQWPPQQKIRWMRMCPKLWQKIYLLVATWEVGTNKNLFIYLFFSSIFKVLPSCSLWPWGQATWPSILLVIFFWCCP